MSAPATGLPQKEAVRAATGLPQKETVRAATGLPQKEAVRSSAERSVSIKNGKRRDG